MCPRGRHVRGIIKEFLLNFRLGRGCFDCLASLCVVLWVLWGKPNYGCLGVLREILGSFGPLLVFMFSSGLDAKVFLSLLYRY